MTQIKFFDDLLPAVISGQKTITIRSLSGLKYLPGSCVQVISQTTGLCVCEIKIISVEAILFSQINDSHARREQMTLTDLKNLIAQIYPDTKQLSLISFKLLA